jgi:hypothetical protein
VIVRSPAAAFAWEFRQRHRWGFIALASYLFVLAMIRLFVLRGQRLDLDEESFALVVIVPLASAFIYFLAAFSFGLSGDLAGRQSIYPARMFTLPVTTAALAGWPMLYGTAASAVLWFATRLMAIWPSDVAVPIVWPALLAASLLAWTQALTWMPYGLPGLRVIVTVLWLVTIDAIVMLALNYKAPEPVMLAILAPHVPLAFLAARFAVGRARRGDVPDWRGIFALPSLQRRQSAFLSPARAQTWLEWRQHGWSLPALVAILLPFELALLLVFRQTPVLIFEVLVCVLLTPPFMALFVAPSVGKFSPFIATRPLPNASLIAAKLKATFWSALAACLLVLIAIPIALRFSGTLPTVLEWKRDLVEFFGIPRAVAIALLGLFALLASTWKQLVQNLYIGMSGREWLVKASVFVALAVVTIALPFGHWLMSSKPAMAMLWTMFPWIAAVLVCIKISAGAWIAMRLRDHGLVSDRALIAGALCWDGLVFALFGLLVWIVPTLLIHGYELALVAILEVPLVRLSAAPLALAWNRHR